LAFSLFVAQVKGFLFIVPVVVELDQNKLNFIFLDRYEPKDFDVATANIVASFVVD